MTTYIQRMMFALSLGFLGVILITTTAHSATAQCTNRAEFVAKLKEHYSEAPQNIGLMPNGSMIETFAHPETGTWTILITSPEGVSCMVASGTAYEIINTSTGQPV